jgi:UDP-GlcNAc:undecaprenyl-phosphate GlcNAc-1-phosphate transferase
MIPFALKYVMVLIATIFMAVVLTPLVRFLALRIGAVDNPNARRINKVPMPSAGGLAIFISFAISSLVFLPLIVTRVHFFSTYFEYVFPIVVAGAVIILTGLIDDVRTSAAT